MKKFRKALLVSVATLAMTGGLVACKRNDKTPDEDQQDQPAEQTVSVTGVSLDVESLDLHIGDTRTLVATVSPENATNKALRFTSTRATVATVSDAGVVTAVGEGTTIIVAQSVEDASKFAQVVVNVTKLHVPVSDLSVDKESIDLKVGGSSKITATVSPENATNKTVTFSSSKPAVATVDAEGNVSAVAEGTAYIFVVPEDAPAKQKMVVVNVSLEHIAVTDVEVSTSALTLTSGQQSQISASVAPNTATNKDLEYVSSNEAVATVSESGLITAVANGTASITVQSVDNPAKFATVTVTVSSAVVAVTGVDIAEPSVEIAINSTTPVALHATVNPSGASNPSVSWSTSDPSVVYVSQAGVLTPIGAGEADVTVTTADGGFTDTCHVTITKTEVESISMSIPQYLFEISSNPESDEKTHQLNAIITPSTATYKEVEWASSNPNVASVDQTGLVTRGNTTGVATISAVHKDSGKVATCVVTVQNKKVQQINLSHSAISFISNATGADAQRTLVPELLPADVPAADQGIHWESSDTNVCTVSNGVVTLVGYGETGQAVITATSVSNPSVYAQCSVTVALPNEYDIMMPAYPKKSYQSYLTNSGEKINELEEFAQMHKTYKVGDDNPVNLLPVLNVYKGTAKVDQSNWAFPFTINVTHKVGGAAASSAEYEVVSDRTVDIQFKSAAIGNVYRVEVIPHGIDPDDIEDATTVYEVEVIDGFNMTDEYDFLYLDDTHDGEEFEHHGDIIDAGSPNYESFKRANGLDETKHYSTLILHKDMTMKREHIPSRLFYTMEDANNGGWSDYEKTKSVGSLKDRVFFYRTMHSDQTGIEHAKIEGNYFSIDWSGIPVVRRPDGETETPSNKVNSHAAFWRVYSGGASIENLNIIGNAHAAASDAQNYAMGGLIGFKYTGNTTGFSANNIIGHAIYITFMSEGGVGSIAPEDMPEGHFTNMKCFDNYNSFIYNWGGHMIIENSYFEGCGGPVVIQDHTGVSTDPATFDTSTMSSNWDYIDMTFGQHIVNGYKPVTEFNDCDIRNYVIGTEAWFNAFGATALVTTIKKLSDKLGATDADPSDGALTFLFDENNAGTTYAAAAAANKDCMMNLIVLNKSGSAEATTAFPVDGEVIFRTNGVKRDDFNYLNPVSVDLTLPAEDLPAEQARFTGEAQVYGAFRGIQGMGLPIYETAGGHAAYAAASLEAFDSGTACNMEVFAASGGASVQAPPAEMYNNVTDHVALYFNGMMLVFQAGHVGH